MDVLLEVFDRKIVTGDWFCHLGVSWNGEVRGATPVIPGESVILATKATGTRVPLICRNR